MLEIHLGGLQLLGVRGGIILGLKRWNCKLFLQVSFEYLPFRIHIHHAVKGVELCVESMFEFVHVCVYVDRGQGSVKFAIQLKKYI